LSKDNLPQEIQDCIKQFLLGYDSGMSFPTTLNFNNPSTVTGNESTLDFTFDFFHALQAIPVNVTNYTERYPTFGSLFEDIAVERALSGIGYQTNSMEAIRNSPTLKLIERR